MASITTGSQESVRDMSSLPMGHLNASTRPWSVTVDMNTAEVFGKSKTVDPKSSS